MQERTESKSRNKTKPAAAKVAREITKLRIKYPDATPEEILEKVESRFIKNFSVAGGGNELASAVTSLLPTAVRDKMGNNPGAVVNGGAEKASKFSAKKILEKYILSVSLLYGRNPRNASQAFQEILNADISEFVAQGKTDSEKSQDDKNVTMILMALGVLPKVKDHKKLMSMVVPVAAAAVGFMGAKEAQKEFANQLVEQVRESLGDAPEVFSEALEADRATYLATKAEKAEKSQNRADKSRERVRKLTEKVHLPRRSSEARGAGKKSKKPSKKQAEA